MEDNRCRTGKIASWETSSDQSPLQVGQYGHALAEPVIRTTTPRIMEIKVKTEAKIKNFMLIGRD
jgi:hypothetical protein